MEIADKIKRDLSSTQRLNSEDFNSYLKTVLRKEIAREEEESGSEEQARFNSLVIVLLEAAKNGLDKSQLEATLGELMVTDETR